MSTDKRKVDNSKLTARVIPDKKLMPEIKTPVAICPFCGKGITRVTSLNRCCWCLGNLKWGELD